MKFYYVYILKSIHHSFIYVGFTENLKPRFIQHNSKEELSTKAYTPFELIHYEAYRNIKDAKRREQYLKTTKGKTTLRYMLKEYLNNLQSIRKLRGKSGQLEGKKECPRKNWLLKQV